MLDLNRLCGQVEREFDVSLVLPEAVAEGFPDWCQLSRAVAALALSRGAKIIGISGSQGSGKSYLAEVLTSTCNQLAADAIACSIDDFYLSRADRAALAQQVHPLLLTRGVPGTHDWAWMEDILGIVQGGGGSFRLPKFNKGLDERRETVTAQARTLVMEGWCMGVVPQTAAQLAEPCNALEKKEDPEGIWRGYVNRQIAEHYLPLWRYVDLWIHLRIPGFEQVHEWRAQQEQQLPEQQRMSAREMRRFIEHYERLTRWIWTAPAYGPGLVVSLDARHRVSGITVSSTPRIPPDNP